MNDSRRTIPIVPVATGGDGKLDDCSAAEPFALMVLGDSMAPEFVEGEIIIIEPEGLAQDGSYVLAQVDGEYIFRQLLTREGRWWLAPLNRNYASREIPDLSAVKGVVIQKQRPGSRRTRKSYLPAG